MKFIPEEALRQLHGQVDGICGLYVSVPGAGEQFAIGEHQKLDAASTIKIPLLALLLKDGESGRLDLDAPVPFTPENQVLGSGVLKSLGTGISMSLYDYAVLMIIISDNSATNQVIDAVGIQRANAFFAENGWNDTHLAHKLYFPKPMLSDGTVDYNSTSAADLGNMMEKILAGTMVSEAVSRNMMQIMAAQQFGKLNLSLPVQRFANTRQPLPPVPEGKVIMANKGGSLIGKVLHDAAVMLLPNGRNAILAMTTGTRDNDKAEVIMKQVSKVLYDRLIAE